VPLKSCASGSVRPVSPASELLPSGVIVQLPSLMILGGQPRRGLLSHDCEARSPFPSPLRRKSPRRVILRSGATKNLLLRMKKSRCFAALSMTVWRTFMHVGGPKAHAALRRKSTRPVIPRSESDGESAFGGCTGKQIPRGVYPELLRFAQDGSKWSERARDDRPGDFHANWWAEGPCGTRNERLGTFVSIGGPKAHAILGRTKNAIGSE